MRRVPILILISVGLACASHQDVAGPMPSLDGKVQDGGDDIDPAPKANGTGVRAQQSGAKKPAAARQPRAKISLPEIGFERYQLENGLTVILHQDTRLPLCAVSVWYHVGAINERPGRSGFAHLFEHMMFQGSPHVGEDQHFKILEQIGATDANGTTEHDRTNYIETVPSNELTTALWLESDRMGFLLSSLTEKSLKNQIDVVQNERRQSIENAAYGLMREKIAQLMYPEPHPYYGDVIGSMKDIGAANLSDVQDFFQTYYTPANAVLTIAGDFDTDETKALVQKYFGSLKGRPKPERPVIAMPKLSGEKRVDFDEPVARLARLSINWTGPSAYQPDTAELDMLCHVISGLRSSRLQKKVTFDDQIAQSASCHFQEHLSGGMISIDLVLRPGRTLDEAEKAVDQVLADFKQRPASWEELDRALNQLETEAIRGLEQLGGMGGRAEQLQEYQFYLGDPGKLAFDLERYEAVTPEALARVLDKYMTKDRLVVRATPVNAAGAAAPKANP